MYEKVLSGGLEAAQYKTATYLSLAMALIKLYQEGVDVGVGAGSVSAGVITGLNAVGLSSIPEGCRFGSSSSRGEMLISRFSSSESMAVVCIEYHRCCSQRLGEA